ncbi:Pyrroline-5-carboxylate reductase [Fundidesulfovibrio magnetotacticus]|uniref:Pyrroline-5-carboxylate reductase n=1 Tax=Fundidesulfovibrio magnetotacticus TaxID=2730080 RepID=A0A6V8LK97_9BACT|nr:pyrroline-5-carboxylate reductase [Fundidesulfovibrio magnetotacticus]GFK93142.1 Pyrroline-5-carboxylate reductase [Fundidesulfovibrio magnetotacticus]
MAAISFIGTGNMGAALIKGLSGAEGIRLAGFDLDREKLNALCAQCALGAADTMHDAVAQADYVVLCVKPQQMKAVLTDIHPALTADKCLISIAAGVTTAQLTAWSGEACPVVRVMPNTPALVGGGVSAVCLDHPHLTAQQKQMVQRIFGTVGSVHVLEEKAFDAFTAVAGSGPAYVFYFMEALIEASVHAGLSRPQSASIVAELFEGSLRLARESMTHPSILREMVTSPAGTTIAALAHMDRMAVRASILDAVDKAKKRSEELGR